MRKNWIDIDKLSDTLGIKYEKTSLYVVEGSNEYSFCFKLYNSESIKIIKKRGFEPLKLFISPQIKNTVFLQTRIYEQYSSTIDFGKITDVTFIPEYKKVIFESMLESTFSILVIYGVGMFDLHYGGDKSVYKKTIWASLKDSYESYSLIRKR